MINLHNGLKASISEVSMLPGETINSGAPDKCPDCGVKLELRVCHSAAGYYLGTQCNCGPYSRESGYYKTQEEAAAALRRSKGLAPHQDDIRTTRYTMEDIAKHIEDL
jgi:hypothetical protein